MEYSSTFNLTIQAQSNITGISAADLQLTTEVDGNTARISSSEVPLDGREINITFKTENMGSPQALVSRNASGDMAAMISFVP